MSGKRKGSYETTVPFSGEEKKKSKGNGGSKRAALQSSVSMEEGEEEYEGVTVEGKNLGIEVCSTFDQMHLKENLLRGIYSYGFEKPSAIQQRAIKPISQGRDVIAQSQSGTGKTAVFSIGVLQALDSKVNEPMALVLSPTRELAEQTNKVISTLGDFMNVKAHACIGGKSIGADIKILDRGVQVVSGTPGRVYDMIKRKNLTTRSIKMLVIDEADEMLNRGFKENL